MPHRHNVMKPRHKMAAVSAVAPHWPAARVRHLAFIYIYGCNCMEAIALTIKKVQIYNVVIRFNTLI